MQKNKTANKQQSSLVSQLIEFAPIDFKKVNNEQYDNKRPDPGIFQIKLVATPLKLNVVRGYDDSCLVSFLNPTYRTDFLTDLDLEQVAA
jgi:hypothetical protein